MRIIKRGNSNQFKEIIKNLSYEFLLEILFQNIEVFSNVFESKQDQSNANNNNNNNASRNLYFSNTQLVDSITDYIGEKNPEFDIRAHDRNLQIPEGYETVSKKWFDNKINVIFEKLIQLEYLKRSSQFAHAYRIYDPVHRTYNVSIEKIRSDIITEVSRNQRMHSSRRGLKITGNKMITVHLSSKQLKIIQNKMKDANKKDFLDTLDRVSKENDVFFLNDLIGDFITHELNQTLKEPGEVSKEESINISTFHSNWRRKLLRVLEHEGCYLTTSQNGYQVDDLEGIKRIHKQKGKVRNKKRVQEQVVEAPVENNQQNTSASQSLNAEQREHLEKRLKLISTAIEKLDKYMQTTTSSNLFTQKPINQTNEDGIAITIEQKQQL